MAYPLASSPARPSVAKAALAAHQRLQQEYGHHPWAPRYEPLSELIASILSQNTSDVNSGRAFQSLREAFPTWQQVIEAPAEAVAASIQSGGLAQIKAPRIQAVLGLIRDRRGSFSLDFLRESDPDDAKAWLLRLPGVGSKTASIVLLFALGKPALPVDTHVHRVTRRLGLIGERDSAEKAHDLLEAQLPPEAYYDFHLNVLAHGRRVCSARNPKCTACVLNELCRAYQRFLNEGEAIK